MQKSQKKRLENDSDPLLAIPEPVGAYMETPEIAQRTHLDIKKVIRKNFALILDKTKVHKYLTV
jgi:hypothetical protein